MSVEITLARTIKEHGSELKVVDVMGSKKTWVRVVLFELDVGLWCESVWTLWSRVMCGTVFVLWQGGM